MKLNKLAAEHFNCLHSPIFIIITVALIKLGLSSSTGIWNTDTSTARLASPTGLNLKGMRISTDL